MEGMWGCSYLREVERPVWTGFGLVVDLSASVGALTVLACVQNPCLMQTGVHLWTDLGRGMWT